MNHPIRCVCASLLALSASSATADTLQAGPGKTYATPCAAIAAATSGDVVEVDPVTYAGNTCAIPAITLTVRGVGGRATLDVQGTQPAQRKGIFVTTGGDVTFENLVFQHAEISDDDGANAAGIRMQGGKVTVRNCVFRENQNGILAEGDELLVERSEFDHNGIGNGCSSGGCTHNMYVGNLNKFTLQYSWSHNVETAHLVKSRAKLNFILFNRIGSEGNLTSSRQIDLPNGGETYVIGNTFQKDPQAGNSSFITYGAEGLSNPSQALYVVNNTFWNQRSAGTFVEVAGGADTAVVKNNIFAGNGTPWTQGTVSADNFVGDPQFINAAAYDFHLASTSPARNLGVDPGATGTRSLAATDEYVHPLESRTRSTADGMLDCGAFESGDSTPSSSGGPSSAAPLSSSASPSSSGTASAAPPSSGTPASSAAPVSSAASAGSSPGVASSSESGSLGAASSSGATTDDAKDDEGCACTEVPPSPPALLAALAVLLAWRRRTR